MQNRLIENNDRVWTIVLFVAALLLYTIALGEVALRDWDEGTVAQVAREMAESGHWEGWLFPQLWGAPYWNKPPLVHSLIALMYQGFGVQEWATRLPGAVLSAAAVPLLYQVGCEIFPLRLTALMASGVYLTWLPVVRHGRLAMLDGVVVFFFLIFLLGILRSRRDQRWCGLMGLGLAGMGLTKGLLALLLLTLLLGFIALDTPRLFRAPLWWLGLGLGLGPIVGWYALQGLHWGWSALGVGLGDQGVDRVWTAVERNSGPPWYYLGELLKYAWPWLLFLPWGLRQLWRDRDLSWAKLLGVWSGGYLGTISLMGTKLPWYIFPLYPALALIIAIPLSEAWIGSGGWGGYTYTPRSFPRIWSRGLLMLTPIALGGVYYFSPWGLDPSGRGMLSLLIAAAGLGAAGILGSRRNPLWILVLGWGWYLSLLVLMTSPHWLWELAEDYPVKPVATIVQKLVPPEAIVYTNHPHHRPSLDFYSQHPVQSLTDEAILAQAQPGDTAYYLVTPDLADRLMVQGLKSIATAEGWVLVGRYNLIPSFFTMESHQFLHHGKSTVKRETKEIGDLGVALLIPAKRSFLRD